MKKIVILGCENSHAKSFLTAMKDTPDVTCIGVYSDEPEASAKISADFGVPVMKTPDELVGKVDGVMVTARAGARHLPLVTPYLAAGVPVFMDKPITASEEEAIALARALMAANVPVTGGSSCKRLPPVLALRDDPEPAIGGFACAPLDRESPYGGFTFYAPHLISLVTTVFGDRPRSVRATDKGKTVSVLFDYGTFTVTGLYADHVYSYSMTRLSGKGAGVAPITDDDFTAAFRAEYEEFCDLLAGGKMTESYEDLIRPVFIMNAIWRSVKSGKEEPIHEVLL